MPPKKRNDQLSDNAEVNVATSTANRSLDEYENPSLDNEENLSIGEQETSPDEQFRLIQARAYFLWEQAGKPDGEAAKEHFWIEAEKSYLGRPSVMSDERNCNC